MERRRPRAHLLCCLWRGHGRRVSVRPFRLICLTLHFLRSPLFHVEQPKFPCGLQIRVSPLDTAPTRATTQLSRTSKARGVAHPVSNIIIPRANRYSV